MAKAKKPKGDIGKSGKQYGYTLAQYEANGKKLGLFVSPEQYWKSQKGTKYKDFVGRTQTIGEREKVGEMNRWAYKIMIGLDLGSKLIPDSAEKYARKNVLFFGGEEFEKGGSLPKNKYVRNSDIKEITLSLDGVETTLEGKDILDGVHVKTGSKDGYEIKPHKEVKANQAIAIKEVLDHFRQFRDLGEMEAGMLYALRDKDATEVVGESDFSGMKGKIYEKLINKYYIDSDGYGSSSTYSLEDRAKDFIEKVEARLATRKGVKAGTDMFPETANIPELKLKQGGKMTGDWRTYYYLVVDMDERGSYGATVYPAQGHSQVWDCDEETVAELIEDGFLKYKPHEDLDRLSKYLSDMKVVRKGSEIISEEDFEALKDNDNVIEFDIPEWAVSALINGDYSGMNDEDEKDLNKFTDKIVEKYGNANFSLPSLDEQLYSRFQHGNDIRKNQGGDVVTLYLLPSKEHKSGGIVNDNPSTQGIYGSEFLNIFGV